MYGGTNSNSNKRLYKYSEMCLTHSIKVGTCVPPSGSVYPHRAVCTRAMCTGTPSGRVYPHRAVCTPIGPCVPVPPSGHVYPQLTTLAAKVLYSVLELGNI